MLKPMSTNRRWSSAAMDIMPFWVRFYDVPPHFFTNKNATGIANKIGTVVSIDRMWRNGFMTVDYIRVWVEIHLSRPLLMGLFLLMEEGVSLWCYFKRHHITDEFNRTMLMYGPWVRFGTQIKHCLKNPNKEDVECQFQALNLEQEVANNEVVAEELARAPIPIEMAEELEPLGQGLDFEPALVRIKIHVDYQRNNKELGRRWRSLHQKTWCWARG
uniref:DUF4283 domain-containing protein n=1 Tax=Cannabis sativa TaxID=3483 RepID=A0A803Q8G2_CANSA